MSGTNGFNFSPGPLIKSSEMNQNFEWFRGHYLPITQSGTWANTTGVYDLGSNAYKWRNLYLSGSLLPDNGYTQPGTGESLKIIRGGVSAAGAILFGSGFSVTRSATGTFLISFTSAFISETPSVLVTSASPTIHVSNNSPGLGDVTIQTNNFSGVSTDTAFHFLAIGRAV